MEYFYCKEGYVEMIVTKSKLLKNANEVYTIGAYRLFKEQFMKFPEYCQGLVKEGYYWLWCLEERKMLRKFSNLISTSELNINDWECVEEGFRMMKDKIASEVGPYYVNNSDNEVVSSNIKDPVRSCTKGECNIRKKNIVEIKCNQARGKRKSALTHASRIKAAFMCMTNVYVNVTVRHLYDSA
ncbi:hypothetical protein M9H77_34790 [Catharanthus roseus]|uniref:Uncharacterized protein n=1 Tax=Catharanthus roseus TaxID=4058 RepID=A0ACB9ZMF5_CATRO|nr:hypothetical protein M9H77_34790 [Catharanthus roseus]